MTASRSLPDRPSLESLRKQAKKIARQRSVTLRDAQLILAREYGYVGWRNLIHSLVWIEDDAVAQFTGDGPLITDDRPMPEYFLLRRMFGPPSPRVTPRELLRASSSR